MKLRQLIGLGSLLLAVNSVLANPTRDDEISHCRKGDLLVWEDGRDRKAIASEIHFRYRHDGAPSWFSAGQPEEMVRQAARAWGQCGLPVSVSRARAEDIPRPDTVLIHWSSEGSRGHFGLADLGQRTLALGPGAFELLRQRNPAHDAGQTLQMVLSHEMGHFFGLMAHSRRCIDVLSYYDDGKGKRCHTRNPAGLKPGVDYRHTLPTACDIERCRAINGLPPLPEGRLPREP